MTYTIKPYDASFLDQQVAIGSQVLKNYRGRTQASKQQLLELYAQVGFDPETKWYAFLGEDMVGFVTSKIENGADETRARLIFPLYFPEYASCVPPLMEQTIATLRQKGVAQITATASKLWGDSCEIATSYAFVHARDYALTANIDVANVSIQPSASPFELTCVDGHDATVLEQLFATMARQNEPQLQRYHAQLEAIQDRIITHLYIRSGDDILAHNLLYLSQLHQTEALCAFRFSRGNDSQQQQQLIRHILAESIESCRSNQINRLKYEIRDSALEPQTLRNLGIVFDEVYSEYVRAV